MVTISVNAIGANSMRNAAEVVERAYRKRNTKNRLVNEYLNESQLGKVFQIECANIKCCIADLLFFWHSLFLTFVTLCVRCRFNASFVCQHNSWDSTMFQIKNGKVLHAQPKHFCCPHLPEIFCSPHKHLPHWKFVDVMQVEQLHILQTRTSNRKLFSSLAYTFRAQFLMNIYLLFFRHASWLGKNVWNTVHVLRIN